MIDLNFFRKEPEIVSAALKKRGVEIDLQEFFNNETNRKKLQTNVEELQAKRNRLAKEIGICRSRGESFDHLMSEASEIPKKLDQMSEKLKSIQILIDDWLSKIPNLPCEDVPEGFDETSNLVVRSHGKPKNFNFEVKDHVDLGLPLGLDFDSASKISGTRFAVMKGGVARLHRALGQFMLDVQTSRNGYTECSIPVIVNSKTLYGTGQLPKFKDDLFLAKKGGQEESEESSFLIPTSEVSLANLEANKILTEADLPVKYSAHSLCFRSEAGSYGKDTKGLIRQHQFEKVELVQLTLPSNSNEALEQMVYHAEMILQELDLPYRVVLLCAGDMGFSATKTFDIEVWLPSQNCYREISSCSNCNDFQARRMNARYKSVENGKSKNLFVHTLNGSGLAVGRCLIAVLENFQNSDGSVDIPVVLQEYMGGLKKITP